jgi:hypothetical protein
MIASNYSWLLYTHSPNLFQNMNLNSDMCGIGFRRTKWPPTEM